MHSKVQLIFKIVILPIAITTLIIALNKNGFFNIREIPLEILDSDNQQVYYTPFLAKLQKELDTNRGQSLLDIKISRIYKVMAKLDWIEKIAIQRQWPNILKIEIQPKVVQLIFLDNGKLYPVIRDGRLQKSVAPNQAPDVAFLVGKEFQNNQHLRKQAVSVMNEIPDQGPINKKNISEIKFDQKDGFWIKLMNEKIDVKIGSEQVAIKAQRVSQVLNYLEEHQFKARVIDADLSKKVLVRLRKDP